LSDTPPWFTSLQALLPALSIPLRRHHRKPAEKSAGLPSSADRPAPGRQKFSVCFNFGVPEFKNVQETLGKG